MIRALAIAAVLLLAWPARADVVTISVTANVDGEVVPVGGARVAVVPADAVVYAEQALMMSAIVTGEDGSVAVERPATRLVILAGLALRGTAVAWAGPHDDRMTLELPAEAVLEGRVTDPDGEPVPAAEILVAPERAEDIGEFLAPGTVAWRELTDGEGRFRVLRLAAGRRYRVLARAPGFAPTVFRDQTPGGEVADIRLRAGAVVKGLVIAAPGGEPVGGAQVVLAGVTATTDASGAYTLRGVPPGRARIEVRAAGAVHIEDEELVLSEGELRLGLVLRVLARARLRGRVLTPATLPAVGASIFLRYPDDPDLEDRLPPDRIVPVGSTDEDGRFDFPDLLPAQGVDLIVRHPEHAPVEHVGYAFAPGRTVTAIVLLREGGALEGLVRAADTGEPVAGAEVLVIDESEDAPSILAGRRTAPPTAAGGTSDEEGRFRVGALASGRKSVIVRADGRPSAILSGIDVAGGGTRSGLVVYLGAGASVSGHAADEAGEPIPGASLLLLPPVGPPLRETAAPDGTFRFQGVPEGAYRLRAAADGYLDTEVFEVIAPAAGIEVVLRRGDGLHGRVLIEDSSEPAPGATVRALLSVPPSPLAPDREHYRLEGSRRASPVDGSFRFTGLAPGSYRLEAVTSQGLFARLDGLRIEAGDPPATVTLRVRAGLSIHGRVIAADTGTPVEGATVAVASGADDPGPLRATTGPDGRFSLPGVPFGFHTLLVAAADFAPRIVPSVEVREAADTFVPDIVLGAGAVVRGRIETLEGVPRAGLTVRLESAELGGSRTRRTDERGRFRFERVADGAWLAVVEDATAGTRREILIRVAEGEEVVLDLGSTGEAALAGQVLSSGEPVGHARIEVLPLLGALEKERIRFTSIADGAGNFLLPDLPAGDLLVLVLPPGRRGPPTRFNVRLLPGPLTVRDLLLPDAGIEVRVEALDTGDPVAGAVVRVEEAMGGTEGTFLSKLESLVGEASSGRDGTAHIPGLAPGTYRVIAFRDGFGRTEVGGVRVTPGAPTPVRIAMPTAGTLSGLVLDGRDRPVAGAEITILDEAGLPVTRETFLRTDTDGRFRARTLSPGRYTVRARAEGRARAELFGVPVGPGTSEEVELRLAREGRILLTVFGPGARPIEGARIVLTDFWGRNVPFPEPSASILAPYRDPSLTGENGTLLVAHLPPGIFAVAARFPGHAGAPVRVRVLEGELSRSALVLLPVDNGR